jgi:hypothetical protein
MRIIYAASCSWNDILLQIAYHFADQPASKWYAFMVFGRNGAQKIPFPAIVYRFCGLLLMKWYAFSNCVSYGWPIGLKIICFFGYWSKWRPDNSIFRDCVLFTGLPAHEMICFFKLRIIWLTNRPQNNMLFWLLVEMAPRYFHFSRLRIIYGASSSWNDMLFRIAYHMARGMASK